MALEARTVVRVEKRLCTWIVEKEQTGFAGNTIIMITSLIGTQIDFDTRANWRVTEWASLNLTRLRVFRGG